LAKSQAVVEIMGKLQRALGSDLREHGHVGAADEALSVAFTELRGAGVTTKWRAR